MADGNETFTALFVMSLKEHLRLIDDTDDALLTLYSLAIWSHLRELCDFDWETSTDDPAHGLYAAALLLAADLYEHRTAQVDVALYENKAAQMLIYPHRVWS